MSKGFSTILMFLFVMTFYYECFKVLLCQRKDRANEKSFDIKHVDSRIGKYPQRKFARKAGQNPHATEKQQRERKVRSRPRQRVGKSDAQIQYELDLQIPPPLKLYELLYDEMNRTNRYTLVSIN